MTGTIPHLRVVVGVTAFVLAGFLGVSAYVLGWGSDLTTKGNIIGTWVNFAMLAVGFWLGSSSGGKVKDLAPTQVTVANTSRDPVPTTNATSTATDAPAPELAAEMDAK